jgi:hypothetical protein
LRASLSWGPAHAFTVPLARSVGIRNNRPFVIFNFRLYFYLIVME